MDKFLKSDLIKNCPVTGHEHAGRYGRRSLFAVEDIAEGELLTGKNIRSIRPGYGLPPEDFPEILGKKASVHIRKGTPLHRDMFG